MVRTWTVEVEGKKHLIELDYPAEYHVDDTGRKQDQKDGKLVVDGVAVETWATDKDVPKEVSFDLAGKPAALRKKGFFATKHELFLEGQQIKSK